MRVRSALRAAGIGMLAVNDTVQVSGKVAVNTAKLGLHVLHLEDLVLNLAIVGERSAVEGPLDGVEARNAVLDGLASGENVEGNPASV